MTRPKALVDMDGTLCDYASAMARDMKLLKGPEEPEYDLNKDHLFPPHIKARYEIVRKQPDWWFNLEPLDGGRELLRILLDTGYKIHILTRAPQKLPTAWEQKVKWINKHVPYAHMTISHEKGDVYGRVLVDDWPEYVKAWIKNRPRGLVILPDQPWNKDVVHPQVLRHYPGEGGNGEEVRERLYEQWEATP